MLTQRLGSHTQKNSEFIDSLINEITAHKGSCDEVWFATDYGFPPLEKHKKSADALIESAEKFRKAGIRVSLQLSNSIGHGEYMRSQDCTGLVSPDSKVQHMVDADGTVAGYCFCWNDEVFREYTFSALRYYLRAVKPYTLWVDDDLRAVNHAPVSHGCFCKNCIGEFNRRYGTDFDREGLVEAVHKDVEIRKKHIEFLRSTIYDFTYKMGLVVHEELPQCRMGLQGCANGGYTGYGYQFIFDAMKDATGFAPSYRAGGGAYNDYSPKGFIEKSSFIAYQNMMLPDYVEDKRPEIESLPDVVFGKSIAGTCFETTCYLANGNTAMSYAILMNDYEPMSWHGQMLGAFAQHREYWEKLAETSKKSTVSGITPFFPKTAYLAKSEKPFDYSKEEIFFAESLRYLAIPVGFNQNQASVFVINGRIAETLSNSEAEFLLSKNVVCDGDAVRILSERGYIKNITAKTIKVQELRERFTSHSVNSGFESRTWGGQIWRNEDSEIFGDNLEVISEYINRSSGNTQTAGIASAIFTTEKGAKWAVFGFDMWERTKSSEKRRQFLNVCRYLSGESFAAELMTPIQACIYPAVDESGKCTAVSVINCTVGDSGELKIKIKNPASGKFVFMGQYLEKQKLTAEKHNENEYIVTMPSVKGWSAGTVFCE
ncbi:MAG: hypothetical protein MJ147_10015 [Clostridia bacterium]|nr:hypothetical protein [Clostridia bacterium]